MVRIYDEFRSMFVTVAFFVYIFLTSGLIVNFLQLCTWPIWPLNKQLYRKINCYLALTIWSRECLLKFYLFHASFVRSRRIQFSRAMVGEEQLRLVHGPARFVRRPTRTFDRYVSAFVSPHRPRSVNRVV